MAIEREENTKPEGQISRRKFLKILGGTSALGVAGCAEKVDQNVFPFVKGEVEQIPGVSVWYNSTCTECSAGCGVQVRTREGRAVKVEGNTKNPINRGGLCALGQASLQALYDPDRVRQPLRREPLGGGRYAYKPVSWDEAYGAISEALGNKKKGYFFTSEVSGALDELITSLSNDLGYEHVVFDALQPTALAKASELTYGTYGIPRYDFSKAEAVVSFGADFLETWVSPCEYARDWASSRKSEHPLRFVHIEPRGSLTAANADVWLKSKPGSEIYIALAILRELLESGRGKNLSEDVVSALQGVVKNHTVEKAADISGVAREKILLTIDYLKGAKNSIVIAGGAATATNDPLPLFIVTNFINSVLENVGTTVQLTGMRKPKTNYAKMVQAVEACSKGEVGILFVHDTNPAFNLPSSVGFDVAVNKVPMVVSFSSHLDETSKLAHYILPAHSGLESWGDSRPYEGHYGLVQPVMTPVFDTKQLGDMLITIATGAEKTVTRKGEAFKEFKPYLEASWKDVHQASGVGGDFKKFWNESLERGGYFQENGRERPKVKVNREVFALLSNASAPTYEAKGAGNDDLILLAYPSVKSFDGRAANRPWLQELTDPLTQIVWDSWAEMHPDTAKKYDLDKGDLVTLRNDHGEVTVPVYLTSYIHPTVVAVPMGQGHSSYGRYAEQVGGGRSTMSLIGAKTPEGSGNIPLMSARVKTMRARGDAHLVVLQGSDTQQGRNLARTKFLSGGHEHGDHHDAHHGHHGKKQMYVQREHPVYEWGMAIDLSTCTGCSACVVACSAENNIPVVGKKACSKGREMAWLRIERYHDGSAEELQVSFLPMMCQQCHNAPCEPVCPVFATYHNEEGLNSMAYNRCVGTRYCSNNCSYKVRRFNWYEYEVVEPLNWQLNPDVVKRNGGVMEKCTFCIQRIVEAKDHAKDLGRLVEDGEVTPACVQSCPTQCFTFGNLKDPESKVSKMVKHARAYKVLDDHINTQPAISYLERVKYKV